MLGQIPDQQGRILVINVPAPGIGFDWQYGMPVRTRWRVRSVQATLTTSVVVADRIPELFLAIGAEEVIRITASQLLAGGGAFIFGWMEGERALAIAGQTSRVTALPRGYLINNQGAIGVHTVALDVGDDWTNIIIVVEEWIEPLQ